MCFGLKVTTYWLKMNTIKYLQIPHQHLGRTFKGCDCLGTVQLFYLHELNTVLPEYIGYEKTWYLTDAVNVMKLFTTFGFKKVKTEPEYGDILLINQSGYPKHLGVVIDKGDFLHTLESGTCCHSYQHGEFAGLIHSCYRYKKGIKCV